MAGGVIEQALRELIAAAFAGVAIPPFEDLLAPRFRNSIDPLELAAALRGQPWRDVPVRDLLVHRESLAALSGAGYVAYVAAYLLASVEDTDDAAELVQYVLFSLEEPTRQPEADEARSRLALLDSQQRAAIRAWLEHVRPHHRLAEAILARWV
jgi:hypothetical protein